MLPINGKIVVGIKRTREVNTGQKSSTALKKTLITLQPSIDECTFIDFGVLLTTSENITVKFCHHLFIG